MKNSFNHYKNAEEEERVSSMILRGKPTRYRVVPGRPALLGWGRGGGALENFSARHD